MPIGNQFEFNPGRLKDEVTSDRMNAILAANKQAQPAPSGHVGMIVRQTPTGWVGEVLRQRQAPPHPFKVTAGPGLNAARAAGRVRSALFREIVDSPVSSTILTKTEPREKIAAATHVLADDRYSVIAIEAVLKWKNSIYLPPHNLTNFIWTDGQVDDSGFSPVLSTVKSFTLAQLFSDYYTVVTDTISTSAWEAGTPLIEPDNLRNTLTLDPQELPFTFPHIIHYPLAVVKTESGEITDIHQIVTDHIFDPWPGYVLMVEGDTFEI